MKSGPVAAMAAMLFVGIWLVLGPQLARQADQTPGVGRFEWILGTSKIEVEIRPQAGKPDRFEYRPLNWRKVPPQWLGEEEFQQRVAAEALAWSERHVLLKLFNASGWGQILWVLIGLGGQACFFGRMLVQWVVSEQRRESVVPPVFWWLSFFGGAGLFVYFVWRVDLVGVIGQSTGIVIYARNLRLIRKQERRRRKDEAGAATSA